MNVFDEIVNTIVSTIWSLLPEMLKAIFSISDAIDSSKETILAYTIGVPVAFVSVVAAIVGLIKFFCWIKDKNEQ